MTLAAALLALLLASLPGPAKADTTDLLALFPYTEAARVAGVQPGTQVGAASLGAGWRPAAVEAGGRAVARRTSLYLSHFGTGPRELVVDCVAPDAPESGRRVGISLNGRRVAIARIGPATSPLHLTLRASALRDGANLVELKNPAAVEATSEGALLCRRLAIETPGQKPTRAVTMAFAPRQLRLPAGLSARFFVPLVRTSVLDLAVCAGEVRVRLRGEAGGRIETSLRASASPRIDLAALRGEFGTIELTAVGGEARVCRASLLVAAAERHVPMGTTDTERPVAPKNIVLVVIDTLRADRLGVYGDPRGLTPNMDALAREGLLFERALAQSAWTTPATASILTGTEPTTHGARKLGTPIRAEVPALAEELRAAGLRTAGITTNVNTRGELGFDRGFDEFIYLPEEKSRAGRYVAAAAVLARADLFLDEVGERPFFLYLHLSEPHAPYTPAADAAAAFVQGESSAALRDEEDPQAVLARDLSRRRPDDLAWLATLYDAEVATVDRAIFDLRAALAAHGVAGETLIVLTSDHGEAFGEHHAVGHGRSLFAEELRIPLILHGPGIGAPGRREPGIARQIDLLPTLLELVGRPIPAGVEGESLLRATARKSFAETRLHRPEMAGFVVGERKVVRQRGRSTGTRFAVYDAARDPREKRDVAADHPFLVGWARQELRRRDHAAGERPVVTLDAPTRSRLQMLGYLE
ncbi:MAG: sulfatase [Deltaproteobacteria bacterium]